MSIPYTVRPGDTLSEIARRHGMTWQALYGHPDNAGFRQKRPKPHVISPGDVLMIPDGHMPHLGLGPAFGSPRPLTPQERAMHLVDDFARRDSPPAFQNISRMNVASQLRQRLVDPMIIRQGAAGLCSVASLLASLAQARPEEYVQYVIALYEKGRATIGQWTIKAGHDLRMYVPAPADGIPEADWVAMASMRDSENIFFDYQQVTRDRPQWLSWIAGGAWSGGTYLKEIEQWSRKIGFTQVLRKECGGHATLDMKAENTREAVGLRAAGYKVILLIDASLLTGAGGSPCLNHAVLLTSPVRTAKRGDADTVSLTVFSWGQGTRSIPPAGGTFTWNYFLDRYGGFVAVRF